MLLSRKYLYLIFDFFTVYSALLIALLLKDVGMLKNLLRVHTNILIIFTSVQTSILFLSGLQKSMWRYTSFYDALKIVGVSFISVFISGVISSFMNYGIPTELFIINWYTLIISLSFFRVIARILKTEKVNLKKIRSIDDSVIIIGAGEAGKSLIREIKSNRSFNLRVVALLDDDPRKIGMRLNGVNVVGKIEDLHKVAGKFKVKRIFIAIPSANASLFSRIINMIGEKQYIVKRLPSISEILHDNIRLDQLRKVEPEDLLSREEVDWSLEEVGEIVSSKVVLVTGAGGSIGSEISKQLCRLKPKQLILFENCEFNIYKLEKDLIDKFPDVSILTIVGDVRDKNRLKSVFSHFRPYLVYHVAAYKHVPMVEKNPYEAIRTNIIGTKNVAEVSGEFKVCKFVMVSTDKAVNPTNIMGATKRVAEIIVTETSKSFRDTSFTTTRFGNVLGSSGSVIPLFKSQISKGGPLTVTHRDIERYFMSISEAAKLVIQSSFIGKGGEIYVLDMGKPVKIYDLAKKMIKLAGLKEGVDINIEITGLRPGEKLYEELIADKEKTIPTDHPRIRCAKVRENEGDFHGLIEELLGLDEVVEQDKFRELLQKIVPEYKPMIISENKLV